MKTNLNSAHTQKESFEADLDFIMLFYIILSKCMHCNLQHEVQNANQIEDWLSLISISLFQLHLSLNLDTSWHSLPHNKKLHSNDKFMRWTLLLPLEAYMWTMWTLHIQHFKLVKNTFEEKSGVACCIFYCNFHLIISESL